MALKGCQQTGQNQFQDILLSSLILSGWNLMLPSICNYNYLPCWHISYFGLLRWVFSLQTNRGQLDGKLQIWKEIKAMWHPACHISCLFYWEEGGGSQWGGEATALQFYVGVPKREAKLEPVLCWGHTWNLSYFTPHTWPPSLFKGNFMHSKLRVLITLKWFCVAMISVLIY